MHKDRIAQLKKQKNKVKKKINFEIEKDNNLEERRIVRFKASTETEDRDGDIIKVDGWDFETYKTNPIILYMHQRAMPAVAKTVNIFVDKLNKQLVMDVKFPTLEELSSNPDNAHDHAKFSDMLYNMYKNGYMSTVSVGFMGKKFSRRTDQQDLPEYARGILFEEQELLELSLVTIPSNPDAQMVRSAMAKGLISEDDYKVATEYSKFLLHRKGTLKETGVVEYDPGEIVEEEWDASAIRTELEPIELARISLVWNNQKDREELTKNDSKFPHHETNGDVNKNALIAAKAVILGARGGSQPFEGQNQEDYDNMLESAVAEHLNRHLEDAELDTINVEDIRELSFSKYLEIFEGEFDVDTLNKAYNAKDQEEAYESLKSEKMVSPEGNPSMRDIEHLVDNELRRMNMEAFSLDFYPTEYPSGTCSVYYFNEDILKIHTYQYIETLEGNEVKLGEGKEIEMVSQYKAYADEKAGAEISRKNREKIENAIESSKTVTETLEGLLEEPEVVEEPEGKSKDESKIKELPLGFFRLKV